MESCEVKRLLKKFLGFFGLNYFNERFELLHTVLAEQQAATMAKIASLPVEVSTEPHANRRDDARYQALVLAGLNARAARVARVAVCAVKAPVPIDVRPFDSYLRNLESSYPAAFPIWLQLFENGQRAYQELPKEASCSTWSNDFAMLFRDYVDVYGAGAILDVGCGPYGDPVYLSGFPPQSLCAIEPLPMVTQAEFTVVRAFCEFLPWSDCSFDTVVIATSLDHVLSLNASLTEVRRVLKPGGKLLIWLGSIPGMAEYDEQHSVPLDDFHLFQFDEKWATPLLAGYFSLVDLSRFNAPGGTWQHCFYCLRK